MALDSVESVFKGVNRIDGYKVWKDGTDSPNWYDASSSHYICIDSKANSIAFKIQKGLADRNGCELGALIEAAKTLAESDDERSREMSMVITKLDEAILWLRKRKTDAIRRAVDEMKTQ